MLRMPDSDRISIVKIQLMRCGRNLTRVPAVWNSVEIRSPTSGADAVDQTGGDRIRFDRYKSAANHDKCPQRTDGVACCSPRVADIF